MGTGGVLNKALTFKSNQFPSCFVIKIGQELRESSGKKGPQWSSVIETITYHLIYKFQTSDVTIYIPF